jgi:integrase/recombinase XerD
MKTHSAEHFARQYQTHLNHLKLKGLQPKTIDAYARAIRRLKRVASPLSFIPGQ